MYLPNDKSRTLVNRSSSGSLAKFAAMRRASSLVRIVLSLRWVLRSVVFRDANARVIEKV